MSLGPDQVSVSPSGDGVRPRLGHHTASTGQRPSSGSRTGSRVSSAVTERRRKCVKRGGDELPDLLAVASAWS